MSQAMTSTLGSWSKLGKDKGSMSRPISRYDMVQKYA